MNKSKGSAKKSGRVGNAFSSSLIFGALEKFSNWIYRKIDGSLIGGFFTSYKAENAKSKASAAHDIYKKAKLSDRVYTPVKRIIARATENSAILSFLKNILDGFLSSSMKSYGIFMFSSALYSAIVYIFRVFYFGSAEVKASHIITLIVMLIASVLMIASRQTLASSLLSSPTASFVLLNIVGIRREALEGRVAKRDRFDIPFIAGLIFGLSSIFVRPLAIIFAMLALVAAYLVLIKPEFGVFLIIVCLPFTQTMTLVSAVIYTLVCFCIKVARGKRSVKFELLDAVVLIFLGLTAMGGIVSCSKGSIRPALVYCAFMLGYFLVVNLIRSREWVMRCVYGLIASCSAVALYGLFQNFFGIADATWHDTRIFDGISGRVVSTFENPNVLSEYLIMCIPITLAAVILASAPKRRFSLVCSLAVSLVCLVYTWSRGAWLGFLIGAVLFMLMYSNKTLAVLIVCSAAVPFLPAVIPPNIVERFLSIGNMSDGSTIYRTNVWRSVLEMIKDYWRSGIGIGEEAFAKVYGLYALLGVENAPHSHSLYLQILVELGIVGLIAFIVLIVIWSQSVFGLHVRERRGEKLYSNAVFCGIVAVLAQGMTDYVWYNYRVFLMFWLLLGLGAAIRKTLDSTAPEEII